MFRGKDVEIRWPKGSGAKVYIWHLSLLRENYSWFKNCLM